jgi:hypothetical protein
MDGDVMANGPEHVPLPLPRQGVVIRGKGQEGDKTEAASRCPTLQLPWRPSGEQV